MSNESTYGTPRLVISAKPPLNLHQVQRLQSRIYPLFGDKISFDSSTRPVCEMVSLPQKETLTCLPNGKPNLLPGTYFINCMFAFI